MRTNQIGNGRGRRGVRSALLGAAALTLPLAACDTSGFLEVDDPGVLSPVQVQDSANLAAVHAGALGDFAVAFGGNTLGGGLTEGIVLIGGALGDEFYNTDSFNTRVEVDRREIPVDNAGNTTVFRNLHRARRAAEVGAAGYEQFIPQAPQRAELLSIAGFTYVLLAENYCSGIPFSDLTPEGEFVFGEPLPRDEVFSRALQRFDAALGIALAGNSDAARRQANLARIGRARTLLNLGRAQEAAAAVQDVPTSFVYNVEYSDNTARQNNGVWGLSWSRKGYSVADLEGGNGLDFRSANDPRVTYAANGNGIDGQARQFAQTKYATRNASIPLATGVEARLIEAEAALAANDVLRFASIHNALRANLGLAPLVVVGLSTAELVDLHFRERAFWMYATGHRLGDLRRLVRQYGRDAEEVFPSGAYRRPRATGTDIGSYGGDVNLPVPFDEENNPHFQQCLDRDA